MQSSLGDLIGYLSASGQRSKIVAVGALLPASLQIQYRCEHIAVPLEEAPDNLRLIDIADLDDADLNELAGPDCIVICKTLDELEELAKSRILSAAAHWFEQNALIIHFSPESDRQHALDPKILDVFGQQIGFPALHVGVLPAIGSDEQRQMVALYDREVQDALKASVQGLPPPLAILSAFNEEDVIKEVVEDLIAQGCESVVLDNWSTDGTWEILQSLQNIFCGQLSVERFPISPIVQSSWVDILERKEEIALQHAGRWILHSDADELRRSPFPSLSLAHAMHVAQITGATRIDFTVLNFRPVEAGPYIPGTLKSAFKYFQFGSHPSYFEQRKAWLQGRDRVNLRKSGGHTAEFKNAVDFRYKFWMKHFPVRSMSHGRKKVYRERAQRWSKAEQNGGWHVHYNNIPQDSSFVWPVEQLHEYRRDTFHKIYGLTIITNIAERTQIESTSSAAVQPFLWRSHAVDEQYEAMKLNETEGRITNLIAEHAEAERRIRDLIFERAEAEGRIRDLTTARAEAEDQIRDVIAERTELLTDAQQQIRELISERAEAEGRIRDLINEAAGRKKELVALRNSTSWRVTAPIRSMVERLRRIFQLVKKAIDVANS
jgi:Glycosyl transferase family 2